MASSWFPGLPPENCFLLSGCTLWEEAARLSLKATSDSRQDPGSVCELTCGGGLKEEEALYRAQGCSFAMEKVDRKIINKSK